MQAWKRKAIFDGFKSFLPMQRALRAAYRAIKPYETNKDNDQGLVLDVVSQIKRLNDMGISVKDKTVVEIGTGWKPVLPLLYRMCGARKIITVDQERLLDSHTYRRTIDLVESSGGAIASLNGLVKTPDISRSFSSGVDDKDLLTAAQIEYLAPFKFQDLPDQSADIIVSRDVLEHVPEDLLWTIFRESKRILRPGGILCHTIDVSDHWEHKDKTITKVNFLQYDGPLWKLAGLNPQNFQNRLRRFEYVDILRSVGFRVLVASGEPERESLRALESMQVCSRYAGVPREELAVLYTTIVAAHASA